MRVCIAGATSTGHAARQRERSNEVVGATLRQAREHVGSRGRDEHEIDRRARARRAPRPGYAGSNMSRTTGAPQIPESVSGPTKCSADAVITGMTADPLRR